MDNQLLKKISGGNLPKEHRDLAKIMRIKSNSEKARVLIRLLIIHPLKRRIAKYYLVLLRKTFGLKVIGITGSAGKTTTKEMLLGILRLCEKTVASYENIDSVFNIPTTILKCVPGTKYLILEMGVEYPGEMDFYLWLAKPDIGIITNIFPTHTQFFKNVHGVFKEKKKLVEVLTSDDKAILNANDKFLNTLKNKLSSEIIWYGSKAEIYSSKVEVTKEGKTKFNLVYENNQIGIEIPMIGMQYVENALAAITCAKNLNIDFTKIEIGLKNFSPPKHRMQILNKSGGVKIYDDAYNNNPMAAKTTIDNFMKNNKENSKIIVFGDMLELGADEIKFHDEMGSFISEYKTDALICVGKRSEYTAKAASRKLANVYFFNDLNRIPLIIKKHLGKNTDILIKGSHSLHLEQLVPLL